MQCMAASLLAWCCNIVLYQFWYLTLLRSFPSLIINMKHVRVPKFSKPVSYNWLTFIRIDYEFVQAKPFYSLFNFFWSSVIKSPTLFQKVAIVLSSIKFRKQIRSFIKMLKISDPKSSPESRIWNILMALLMFADYFWRFRYEYEKVVKSSLKT